MFLSYTIEELSGYITAKVADIIAAYRAHVRGTMKTGEAHANYQAVCFYINRSPCLVCG